MRVACVDRVLESCPDIGELPNYFGQLSVRELAECWVACLGHAMSLESGLREGLIGNVLRASIVVSSRLNGVQYVMTTELSGKAKNILDTTDKPVKGASFEISEDPRPAAASRSRGRHDPLSQAMVALKPGAHIRVDPKSIKKATLQQRVNWAKKNGGNKGLAMYVADDGRFIIYIGVGEKNKL